MMRKIVKWIYAFSMLGVMLYAVVCFKQPYTIQSLLQTGLSGLQSAAGNVASSWKNTVTSGQPIPTTQGIVSAPSQDTAPAQTTAAPSEDFAQTGMQGLKVYTYGRTLLNTGERAAYDQIQAGLVGVQTKVPVNSALSPTAMQKVVQYVIADHPEVFYLSGTSMSYIGAGGNGLRHFTISFSYSYDTGTVAAMRGKLRTAVLPILAQADTKTDMVKKELVLHDALVEACAYNIAAASNTSAYPQAFTAYGALVDGSAVCEGYAKAMKLLLDSAGLHSLYVTGTASSGGESGPHAWNMVYVGKWYQVDATFDDPVYQNSAGKYVQVEKKSYRYFNFISKADHVLGVFDSTAPFSSHSENYAVMPTLG
ncbi:MAG: transglutaminase domain-containing protein [Ethanoligenens sp.]